MNTITLTRDQLFEAMENEGSTLISKDSWRWGHTERWALHVGGKFYEANFRIHADDGIYMERDETLECHEIVKQEVMAFKWVRVNQPKEAKLPPLPPHHLPIDKVPVSL